MEAGLVALRIETDKSGGIGKLTEEREFGGAVLLDEEAVEFLIEGIATAKGVDQTGDVVLDTEGVEPGIHFGEIFAATLAAAEFRIEGLDPVAVCALRSHETRGRIKYVLVIVREL